MVNEGELTTIPVRMGKVRVLGYRASVWKKDNIRHVVADVYSPDFGTAEINLPPGVETLTAFSLGVMQDKFGKRHIIVRGE